MIVELSPEQWQLSLALMNSQIVLIQYRSGYACRETDILCVNVSDFLHVYFIYVWYNIAAACEGLYSIDFCAENSPRLSPFLSLTPSLCISGQPTTLKCREHLARTVAKPRLDAVFQIGRTFKELGK